MGYYEALIYFVFIISVDAGADWYLIVGVRFLYEGESFHLLQRNSVSLCFRLLAPFFSLLGVVDAARTSLTLHPQRDNSFVLTHLRCRENGKPHGTVYYH